MTLHDLLSQQRDRDPADVYDLARDVEAGQQREMLGTLIAEHGPSVVAALLRGVHDRGFVEFVVTNPAEQDTSLLDAARWAIDAAEHEVLVSSFNISEHHMLCGPLNAARERGITVKVVTEDPDRIDATPPTSVPGDWAVWPDTRVPAEQSFHPKVLTVDALIAVVGSANLSTRAYVSNVEAGVLIDGGQLPRQIHRWLSDLWTTAERQ